MKEHDRADSLHAILLGVSIPPRLSPYRSKDAKTMTGRKVLLGMTQTIEIRPKRHLSFIDFLKRRKPKKREIVCTVHLPIPHVIPGEKTTDIMYHAVIKYDDSKVEVEQQ